jgi:hypothetical protein
MTQLELQQRALLAVVKGRPGEDPDLRRLASSPEVALLRTIALWWQLFISMRNAHSRRVCSNVWAALSPQWATTSMGTQRRRMPKNLARDF